MSPRSIRRAAERKAAKLAKKQSISQPSAREPEPPRTSTHRVSSPVLPRPEMHPLRQTFRVLESESQELFNELWDALIAEHQPATPTESLLVGRLAEHVWLSQRALRFQDAALADFNETWFALMVRYQTTHDRAFHKCLAELRTLRRERRQPQPEPQFESQKAVGPPETASRTQEFESQKAVGSTAGELDRLSPAEISHRKQQALRKANISLEDFENAAKTEMGKRQLGSPGDRRMLTIL